MMKFFLRGNTWLLITVSAVLLTYGPSKPVYKAAYVINQG